MIHPGPARRLQRRARLILAMLKGAEWNRAVAAARVRDMAAVALEEAASALRNAADDNRVRALVDRALRRLSLVADLEDTG